MQPARDLYDSFKNKFTPPTSYGDQVGAAVSGAGALGGIGLAGNSLYDLHNLSNNHNNPVAVTYGYSKGKGGGHKSMAESYARILNHAGIRATPVTQGYIPVRSSNYSAVIPAGYGPALSDDTPTFKVPIDYDALSDKPLPFVDAKALGGNSSKARALAVQELARQYGFGDNVKNIITISGGETGSALQKKLRALLGAVEGRSDTAILALAANAPDEVKDALAAMAPDRVRVLGALPKDDFLKHLSSSSLNIGYGGSSSITEQLGMRNPQLNMFIDRALNPTNTNNIDFASRYGGIDSLGVSDTESLRARINAILDNSEAYNRSAQVSRHLSSARASRAALIRNLNKLRSSNLGERMSKHLGRLHGGLGLAAVGGLGLNYFMNKQSAFQQKSDNTTTLKNILGGTALGAGALLTPAALPMLRIGVRGNLAKLYANKSTPAWLRNFAGKHQGNAADFLADYTEGARRLGDMPGVRPAIDNWYKFKEKYIPVAPGQPSHDFQRSHFKRFMAGGNREGLRHWWYEVGEDFKNKAIASKAKRLGVSADDYRKELGDSYTPRGAHARLTRGGKAVMDEGGYLDKGLNKGLSEYEAIKALGKVDDPAVKSFLRALALHKQDASKVYTTKALGAPALALGGAGLLAYETQKPTSFIDKLRSSFYA